METVLGILIAYVLSVIAYTLITRYDATHMHAPDVKIFPIIKDGVIDMGIGFAIVIAIFQVWILINNLLV